MTRSNRNEIPRTKPAARRPRARPRRRAASSPAAEAAVARQAAGHHRIRDDHARELAEDYVEIIDDLLRTQREARTVEIARRLGVTHVTVVRTLNRLQREGLIETEPYRSIFLTPVGRELASRSRRRHALVVEFLVKLGVSADTAEIDAEGIEHHISDATLEAIRRYVHGEARCAES